MQVDLVKKYSLLFCYVNSIVSSMNKPRRNFDLPAKHINETDGSNYVPPRARDSEEITRRQGLRPGSVIREYQASGANVAEAIFNYPVNEKEDIDYIRRKLAIPLLNSAWYSFADSAKTPDIFMRRELKLPVLADDKEEWRATKEGLIVRVRQGLAETARLSSILSIQYQKGHETVRTEKKLGRTMGNAALTLISLQHANAPLGMSEADIQNVVMLDALELLEDAKTSHEDTGVHASIAQFADPKSPLSIDWQNNAPRSGEAYDALVQAQSDFGRTA
ncbi:MAG: hypothetical protein JWN75_165 [Candidatus Saccharibacteria bacterium]|nr:hypothetical protein [Candidatus Saccharibacteria bacterium]